MAVEQDDIGSLAAGILGGARYNESDVLHLAGSVLSNLPDQPRPTVMEQTRHLFGTADGEVVKDQDDG